MFKSGGKAAIDTLAQAGISVVFGIPGIHNLPLYDALYQHPTIRHITVRHEQGAGFMADGYARASGDIGVILTTTGPGATNALTPFAEAFADGSRVLLITTGLDDAVDGDAGELHELRDQFGLLHTVTGRGIRVSHPDEIACGLSQVIREMRNGRSRPHLIEIPIEICKSETELVRRGEGETRGHGETSAESEDAETLANAESCAEQIDKLLCRIQNAEQPLIIAGGGSIDASAEVVSLAEALNAAVVTTRSSRGVIPDDHPLFLGVVGEDVFEEYLRGSDVVIAIGTRLGRFWNRFASSTIPPLIHIDIDPAIIGKRYPAEIGWVSNAKSALKCILDNIQSHSAKRKTNNETIAKLRATRWQRSREREPRTTAIVEALTTALPREAIVTMDMTIVCYSAIRMLPRYEPRTCFYPSYYGTLGFSPPAAMGARLARGDRPVVSLCGDGGFLFTGHELATAVLEKIPVTFVVFNDGGFSAIRRAERRTYGDRIVAADLSNPDFVRFAESFGVAAVRVKDPQELAQALCRSAGADEPRLIEMRIDPPLSEP